MLLTDVPQRLRVNVPEPSGLARHRSVRTLYSPEQLAWVIRRERARADRHQCPLTIVHFGLQDSVTSSRDRWRLAHAMLNVLRETDELGWFDASTLCAVLPDTDAAGADNFMARLAAATRGRSFAPKISIYVQHVPEQPVRDRLARTNAPVIPEPRPLPASSLDELLAEPLPWWKRCVDVAVASALLVAVSPLLIAAAVAIRVSSPGPIIFRQQRTGLGGRPFTIFKFRTMCVDAEAKKLALRAISEQDGPAFKLQRDPRVFAAGAFLRKTSIDELPQLLNVLRGEMTLVGPRPLPVGEAEACVGWQQRRHAVTPGLTCIWQVEGRSRVKFDEWMRMDRRYARRRSLVTDLWLVARTVPAVLLRRGAK